MQFMLSQHAKEQERAALEEAAEEGDHATAD